MFAIDRRSVLTAGSGFVLTAFLPRPASASEELLQPEAMHSDIAILYDAYTTLHPGFFRYLTPAALLRERRRLDRFAATPQSLGDFYLALSAFTASIRCGHSFPNPANQPAAVIAALFDKPDRLPFAFTWIDGRMLVTADLGSKRALRPGTEVVAIDGLGVHGILKRMLPYARTDGGNDARKVADLDIPGDEAQPSFDLLRSLLFPSAKPYARITVRANGHSATIACPLLTAAVRDTALRHTDPGSPYRWKFEARGDVGILTMPTWAVFNQAWDWRGFIDASMDSAIDDKLSGIVIDLRDNAGGLDCGAAILSRLIAQPVSAGDRSGGTGPLQNFSRNTVPPPESLLDEQSRPAREALVAIFSEDDRTLEGRRVRMDRYAVDDGDLRQSLLRLFRGKCAFCEAMVETSPYRFRPPEEAGPSSSAPREASHLAHLYYVWLVNDWSNIYPVCDDCRPLEPSIFPIRSGQRMKLPEPAQVEMYASARSGTWPFPASELQVFLDPSGDENFRRNLVVAPDGRLFGSTERGEATVKHFNLDRADLVARRGGVFSENLGRLFAMGDPQAVDFGPFEFADMEFGGTWYLLLYQLAKAMSSGSSSAPRLSSGAIRDYFAQRIGAPNFRKQLEGTLRSLDENPYALIRSRKRTRVVMRGRARPVAFIIENFRSIDQLRLEMPARSSIRADDEDDFSADFGSVSDVIRPTRPHSALLSQSPTSDICSYR